MLVLDRKVREGFWIDGKIFVKVLAVGRHRVKLGVEAPDEIQIWREELSDQQNNGAPAERSPAPDRPSPSQHPGGSLRSA